MRPRDLTRVVLLPVLLLVAATGSGCCPWWQDCPEERRPPSPDGPAVELPEDLGERAFEHVETLVALGPRHSGTAGWERGLDHIVFELEGLGLEPRRDRFYSEAARKTFENVSCTIPGHSEDRLVLGCHHDTKITEGHLDESHNFAFVGANDSASGVGLLLALAAEFVETRPPLTVELAFFDGEESLTFDWNDQLALFGSRRFVAERMQGRSLDGHPLRAMVLVDMVGADHLSLDDDSYSTPWLKDLLLDAARELQLEHLLFARSLRIKDDHLPFRERGVPVLDLIDLADNPQWHTPEDTLEHIRPSSLQSVGHLVLRLIPRIAVATGQDSLHDRHSR